MTTPSPAPPSAAGLGQPGAEWYRCAIPRAQLRELMRRSDGAGLRHFGLWAILLAASGGLAYAAWGSWWGVPAFLVYGVVYSSSEARWHECAHGTPFRTRRLNEVLYHVSSFLTLHDGHLWRWTHARHHSETIFAGRDPEIQVPRPAKLSLVALDLFNLAGGWHDFRYLVMHALAIRSARARDVVPEAEFGKLVLTSRIYLALIAALAGWCVAVGSILPAMFVILPRFYGGFLAQLFNLSQHAALAENVLDHRLNTRTILMNPAFRFLYFNMSYHIEHHMFPLVPFHALPRLHEIVKDQLPRPYRGLADAYREIVPALVRQSRDGGYFVLRELPSAATARA